MKKIALVTCFLDNHGACLQALALQHSIEKLGHSCEIIAYIEPQGYVKENFKRRLKSSILSNARDIITILTGKNQYNHHKAHLSFCRFRKKYLKFKQKTRFGGTKYFTSLADFKDLSNDYDAFVCGSDQIWNPTFYSQNNPVYFLTFANDKKRIAYAPSIGLSEIPQKYLEVFISYTCAFDSLSVREQAGREIIEKTCHRSAKVVLDPTLLVGADFWKSLLAPRYSLPFKEYIFAYIFSNTDACREYVNKIQLQTGLPVIYINNTNLSSENTVIYHKMYSSPIDFLQLINNAKFIVTDSFHGTAFSLLFNKDFYVFKRERYHENIDMYSRIESILSITGLEDRTVSLYEPFAEKAPIDYTQVNENIDVLRADSIKYLEDALLED